MEITVQGVLVANLDTGVDGNHPALASRWRGLTAPVSAAWLDVINAGPNFPEDNNSHGTHVLGTVCGRAISGSDTITVGSAPDAETQATFVLIGDTTINFYMPRELFCYDFESGVQGWTMGTPTDGATAGNWNLMDPELTANLDSIVCQPDTDHTVAGTQCFATNGLAGDAVGANDVDGGQTTLLSLIWDLSAESHVAIEWYTWFTNDNGNNPGQDYFDIDISSDSGTTWVSMLHENADWEEWRRGVFLLEEYIPLTNEVRMWIVAQDQPAGSLVEGWWTTSAFCLLGFSRQQNSRLRCLKSAHN